MAERGRAERLRAERVRAVTQFDFADGTSPQAFDVGDVHLYDVSSAPLMVYMPNDDALGTVSTVPALARSLHTHVLPHALLMPHCVFCP